MISFVCFAVMKIYIVVLCLYGDDVTTHFTEIHEKMYNTSWNHFPLAVQKIFPVVLANCQQPVYLHGYLNVRCTRESVKKVRKGILKDFSTEFSLHQNYVCFLYFISYFFDILLNHIITITYRLKFHLNKWTPFSQVSDPPYWRLVDSFQRFEIIYIIHSRDYCFAFSR